MPNLSKFYQQHQNIEVKVTVSTRPLTEAADYFDLALQTSGRNSGDFELIFTVPDEIFPVCSPDYKENSQNRFLLSKLPNHHLLHHVVHPQDWVTWDEWLAQLNCDTCVGFEGTVYDSYPMMIQSAIEGHGIALGWKQTTKRLINSGQLVVPFEESLKLENGLAVYKHPQCIQGPEMNVFIQWLKHELNILE